MRNAWFPPYSAGPSSVRHGVICDVGTRKAGAKSLHSSTRLPEPRPRGEERLLDPRPPRRPFRPRWVIRPRDPGAYRGRAGRQKLRIFGERRSSPSPRGDATNGEIPGGYSGATFMVTPEGHCVRLQSRPYRGGDRGFHFSRNPEIRRSGGSALTRRLSADKRVADPVALRRPPPQFFPLA